MLFMSVVYGFLHDLPGPATFFFFNVELQSMKRFKRVILFTDVLTLNAIFRHLDVHFLSTFVRISGLMPCRKYEAAFRLCGYSVKNSALGASSIKGIDHS